MTAVVDMVLVASRFADLAECLGVEVVGVQILLYSPEAPIQLHLAGHEPAVDTLADALNLGDPIPEPYANYDRQGVFEGHPVRVYSGRMGLS